MQGKTNNQAYAIVYNNDSPSHLYFYKITFGWGNPTIFSYVTLGNDFSSSSFSFKAGLIKNGYYYMVGGLKTYAS